MAEEDFVMCCTGLIIIIIIAVVLWILVKGAKFLGYIGQWRTGSALKHMSREGIAIRQEPQYQQPQQTYAPPSVPAQGAPGARFCPFCGAQRVGGASFCPGCGNRLIE